jgi:hypothetical protein
MLRVPVPVALPTVYVTVNCVDPCTGTTTVDGTVQDVTSAGRAQVGVNCSGRNAPPFVTVWTCDAVLFGTMCFVIPHGVIDDTPPVHAIARSSTTPVGVRQCMGGASRARRRSPVLPEAAKAADAVTLSESNKYPINAGRGEAHLASIGAF